MKIKILIEKGSVTSIMSEDSEVEIEIFNIDEDPEREVDWDEVTREMHEVG